MHAQNNDCMSVNKSARMQVYVCGHVCVHVLVHVSVHDVCVSVCVCERVTVQRYLVEQ